MYDSLHDSPESLNQLWFVIGMVFVPLERWLLHEQSYQSVADEGHGIALDNVHQVAQVLPRSFHVDKIHQALEGSDPYVHKLASYK